MKTVEVFYYKLPRERFTKVNDIFIMERERALKLILDGETIIIPYDHVIYYRIID